MTQIFPISHVSKLLNIKPYQITYAISIEHIPDASFRFLNKRAFTQEDVRLIARFFGKPIPTEFEDITKGAQ